MSSNKTSGHGPGCLINVREIFGLPLAAHQVTPGIKNVAETVCNTVTLTIAPTGLRGRGGRARAQVPASHLRVPLA